jgi:hypothetical protein
VVFHIFYFFPRSHRHNQHTDHLYCIAASHTHTFITAESWHILICIYHITNTTSTSIAFQHRRRFVPSLSHSFLIYHFLIVNSVYHFTIEHHCDVGRN